MTSHDKFRNILRGAAMNKLEQRELKLHRAARKAVDAADTIIMDASDGTVEETNYLTGEVARLLMERALNPFNSALRRSWLSEKGQ